MTWTDSVARIPADVEQPDKIIGSFTARQVAILGGTGVLLYTAYTAIGDRVPLIVCAAVALPIAVAGILLAVGQHDGMRVPVLDVVFELFEQVELGNG
ncbi:MULTISPECIES: PrgI family protein [unclassified Nonomuraea]|uniref:PrgI family protein n=1 Tax=unclassified Nonomuraea TaxID=2593643 RepID=UPI0033D5ADA5